LTKSFFILWSLKVAKLPQVVQQQATVANIQQMVSVSQQVRFACSTRNLILLKAHVFGNICIFPFVWYG